MSSPQPQLDHIVLHIPYEWLSNPPEYLTKRFTLTPGGTHADGLTANSLICFADGTYIELIAFTPLATWERRKLHVWGEREYGIIDWALTLPKSPDASPETLYNSLREKWMKADIPSSLKCGEPKKGGRVKPNGEKIEWMTAGVEKEERGKVNFWCLDVTPRSSRVPSSQTAITHPSGAIGIARVELLADLETTNQKTKAFDTFLPGEEVIDRLFAWPVDTPSGSPAKIRAWHITKEATIRLVISTRGTMEHEEWFKVAGAHICLEPVE